MFADMKALRAGVQLNNKYIVPGTILKASFGQQMPLLTYNKEEFGDQNLQDQNVVLLNSMFTPSHSV